MTAIGHELVRQSHSVLFAAVSALAERLLKKKRLRDQEAAYLGQIELEKKPSIIGSGGSGAMRQPRSVAAATHPRPRVLDRITVLAARNHLPTTQRTRDANRSLVQRMGYEARPDVSGCIIARSRTRWQSQHPYEVVQVGRVLQTIFDGDSRHGLTQWRAARNAWAFGTRDDPLRETLLSGRLRRAFANYLETLRTVS